MVGAGVGLVEAFADDDLVPGAALTLRRRDLLLGLPGRPVPRLGSQV